MKGSPMARNFNVGSPTKNNDEKSSAASDEYVVEDYSDRHDISEEEVKRHLKNLNVSKSDTMLSYDNSGSENSRALQKYWSATEGRYAHQRDWRQTDEEDVDDSYGGIGSPKWYEARDKWHKSVNWDKESTSSTGETFFSVPKFTFQGSKKSQMSKDELKQYYKKRGF